MIFNRKLTRKQGNTPDIISSFTTKEAKEFTKQIREMSDEDITRLISQADDLSERMTMTGQSFRQAAEDMREDGLAVDDIVVKFGEFGNVGDDVSKLGTAFGNEMDRIRKLGEGTTNTILENFKSLGASLVNAAAGMAIGWALSQVVKQAYEIATANERLKDSAQQVGSTFVQSKNDIESYKDKITELQDKINDSSTSYEDAKAAREQLLTIQDELISKYGTEAENIDLVTQAVNKNVDVLDKLTDAQWQNAKNQFEADNYHWHDFLTRGSDSAMDKMLRDMDERVVRIEFTSHIDEPALQQLSEKLDLDITPFAKGSGYLNVRGTSDEVLQQLKILQQYIKGTDNISKELQANITKQINTLDKDVNKYSDIYSQYILYERIMPEASYEQALNAMSEAYDKFRDRQTSGDEESAEQYKTTLINAYKDLYNEVNSDGILNPDEKSVLKYMRDLYPDLQAEFADFQLSTNLYVDVDKASLNESGQEVLDAINQFTDINDLNVAKNVNAANHDAYLAIEKAASEAGASINQLIDNYIAAGQVSETFLNNTVANDQFRDLLKKFAEAGTSMRSLERQTGDFTDAQKQSWLDAAQGVDTYQQMLDNLKVKQAVDMSVAVVDPKATTEQLKAMQEMLKSTTGLTNENITAIKNYYHGLDGYDATTLFEHTANGIHLNREELAKLDAEMRQSNLDSFKKKQEELAEAYEILKDKTTGANKASQEFITVNQQMKTIQDKARELRDLAAEYDGITSAYYRYVQATGTTNENSPYEGIISGYDNVKKLIDNGWMGVDDVREYLNMFSFEDLSTASVDELNKHWENLGKTIEGTSYSLSDFFTKNDNGSTTKGIESYVKAINQAFGDEYAKLDTETGQWTVDLSNGRDVEVAERFGHDISMVSTMMQSAAAAGFHVTIQSEFDDLLSGLYISAEEAQQHLNNLGLKVDLDVSDFDDSENKIKNYEQQLEALTNFLSANKNEDGTYNFDVDGVKEAIVLYGEVSSRMDTVEHQSSAIMNSQLGFEKLDNSRLKSTIEDLREVVGATEALQEVQSIGSEEEVQAASDVLADALTKATRARNQESLEKLHLSDLIDIDPEAGFDEEITEKIRRAILNLTRDDIELADMNMEADLDVRLRNYKELQDQTQEALDQGHYTISVDDVTVSQDAISQNHVSQNAVSQNTSLVHPDYANNTTSALEKAYESVKNWWNKTPLQASSVEIVADQNSLNQVNASTQNAVNNNGAGQTTTVNADTTRMVTQITEAAMAMMPYVSPIANSATLVSGIQDALNNQIFQIKANANVNVNTTVSGNAKNTTVKTGKSKAYGGIANAYGNAFAEGHDLVGELGQEMVVDPHRGRYYTVGDHGAEFVDLPKDAIVFNHLQTSSLLKRGKTSRGNALASGNAFLSGKAFADTVTIAIKEDINASGGFQNLTDGGVGLGGKTAKEAAKAAKEAQKAAKDAKKTADDTEDILKTLSGQLDDIQSNYKSLTEIVEAYNQNGKLTVDQAQALITTDFKYLALLSDENGKLKLNEEGFQNLAKIKLYEMQVQLARNA